MALFKSVGVYRLNINLYLLFSIMIYILKFHLFLITSSRIIDYDLPSVSVSVAASK